MFLWIFLSVVSSVQAAEPAHLKPGALFGCIGCAVLVEDVLWVNYPYAALRAILRRLKVSEDVDSAFMRLETEANKNFNTTHRDNPLELLKPFSFCFPFVNDTVDLTLESYLGMEGATREKHAWLDCLGEIIT